MIYNLDTNLPLPGAQERPGHPRTDVCAELPEGELQVRPRGHLAPLQRDGRHDR